MGGMCARGVGARLLDAVVDDERDAKYDLLDVGRGDCARDEDGRRRVEARLR